LSAGIYIHTRTGLTIVAECEDNGFWGWVPEMPGCASQGDTLGELFVNIGDAIELCLEIMMEYDMELPTANVTTTGTPDD
jgi:predicted RNase H-like HicB family nuclease